jgi:tRNA threonylcarbamoyl adenosine modification protein YjeE
MLPTTSGGSSFTVALPNEQATRRLVIDVAAAIEPGDLITLSGDLGAGKTMFARTLIRHLAEDEKIAVPSPTFTLQQTYELPPFPLVHGDLYRLSGPAELAELGFDDLPQEAVVLLEWPDRAAGFLPANRLDIALTLAPQDGPEFRNARITGYGTFAARMERFNTVRKFLEHAGFSGAERRRIQGDASTRSYERLTAGDRQAILMISPRRTDGPPVRNGRTYSAIAHLAEDTLPFVAIASGLRERGFSAPEIYQADLEHGFLVIEDLGSEGFVRGDPPAPIEERYGAAVDALVELHGRSLPASFEISPGVEYQVPHYDMDAFLIEAELLPDWYLPHVAVDVSDAQREAFVALWRDALEPVMAVDPTLVLRDFHSPNLLWLPQREGIRRVGLLDFQDALIGPPAYDLASLLQDARVDVPEMVEIAQLGRYARARHQADPNFDAPVFVKTYAALATQRATKILGIFARLNRRDGNPQYLRHMPRVWAYLQRSLEHPALASLKAWYRANVPAPDSNRRAASRA